MRETHVLDSPVSCTHGTPHKDIYEGGDQITVEGGDRVR